MDNNEIDFLIKIVISVLAGMLLGFTLFTFIAAEDCVDKGKISLSGKQYYCSEVYGGEK